MPLQAPRKRETVRAEGTEAMRQLDARIRTAKQRAAQQAGPLAVAVAELADVVESLRVSLAALREELRR